MTADGRSVVSRFVTAVERAAMPEDLFSDDAVLDATVPNWRFSVRGAAAVRAELSRWYADEGRFLDVSRRPIDEGELVEFTLSWNEAGTPHTCHQAHILRLVGDRIARDTAFCGGRWPASLVAEMEEAEKEAAASNREA